MGLPVTSASIESVIEQLNYAVTEKFRNDPEGAEAILQVTAAGLADDGRLRRYMRTHPGRAFVRRKPPRPSFRLAT